ncbi:MAG TPA: acyltransferase family protein [Acidimicrobiales bacterium]|nr:acyltransferase family protein [Acidimicrobiales bacterium]
MAEERPDQPDQTQRGGPVGVMPALDGLRALAVLAVIGYHGALGWLQGGFYGVDAFLVLSGFLITTLLVSEWDRSGGISLSGFWARRARRLLPALLLMLSGVALVVGLFPGVLSTAHLEADAVSSLLYMANWHLAAEHASYFSAYQAQSPLLHTWTLAIEEQFYVVWPLVVLALIGRRSPLARILNSRTRRLGAVLAVAVVGALASAAWMVHLAPAGDLDPSRAYYGSDTRAQGLLIGAAVALVCALWGPVRTVRGRRALGGLGLAGAVGVGAIWSLVPETSPLAFHGGFLLISLACAALVASAARVPAAPVSRVLSLAPIRYLGRVSYGMYLWYWPVLLVMTGARTGLHGYVLLGLRLAVIVGLASASYRWVETPIRRGALPGWRALVALPVTAGATALGMLVAVAAAPLAGAAAPASSISYLASSAQPASPATPVTEVPTTGAPTTSTPGTRVAAATPALVTAASTAIKEAASGGSRPVRILLVGDSMAGTLGVGLAQAAGDYGAQIVNEGQAGCSVSMSGQIKVLDFQLDPSAPCAVNDPAALLADMAGWVRRYQPDVVVYLARSEVLDQQLDGQWMHLGDPAFDAWVRSRFEAMVPVLSSGGAKVVLMTTPYYDTGEEANGSPWPEDTPARVVEDNSIITSVAGPGGAALINLNAITSPNGSFTPGVGGVALRCQDGAHFTAAGGRWLAAKVLPELVKLGREHSNTANAAKRTNLLPSSVPAWWPKLPCAS